MSGLPPSLRVILIGGTSHAGKTTLAEYLASTLGWEYRGTDQFGRHPGRPWRSDNSTLPQHVAEHYATLSVDDLMADVLRHYEKNILPQIIAVVRARASDPSGKGLLLEGSALWPHFIAPLISDQVGAIWLTADHELLVKRIHAESRYAQRTSYEQLPVSKFLERTLAYHSRMEEAISDHGLLSVRIRERDTAETLARRCLEAICGRCSGTS